MGSSKRLVGAKNAPSTQSPFNASAEDSPYDAITDSSGRPLSKKSLQNKGQGTQSNIQLGDEKYVEQERDLNEKKKNRKTSIRTSSSSDFPLGNTDDEPQPVRRGLAPGKYSHREETPKAKNGHVSVVNRQSSDSP